MRKPVRRKKHRSGGHEGGGIDWLSAGVEFVISVLFWWV